MSNCVLVKCYALHTVFIAVSVFTFVPAMEESESALLDFFVSDTSVGRDPRGY